MTYKPHTVWIGGPPVVQPKQEKAKTLKPVATPQCTAFVLAQNRKSRNALICQQRKAGDQFKDIAILAGVSKQRCQQIYSQMRRMERS